MGYKEEMQLQEPKRYAGKSIKYANTSIRVRLFII